MNNCSPSVKKKFTHIFVHWSSHPNNFHFELDCVSRGLIFDCFYSMGIISKCSKHIRFYQFLHAIANENWVEVLLDIVVFSTLLILALTRTAHREAKQRNKRKKQNNNNNKYFFFVWEYTYMYTHICGIMAMP